MSPLRNSKKGCSEKNDVRFPELILLDRSLKEEKKTKSDILISTTVANGEYFYTILPFKVTNGYYPESFERGNCFSFIKHQVILRF